MLTKIEQVCPLHNKWTTVCVCVVMFVFEICNVCNSIIHLIMTINMVHFFVSVSREQVVVYSTTHSADSHAHMYTGDLPI